jgi:hypothetical protein
MRVQIAYLLQHIPPYLLKFGWIGVCAGLLVGSPVSPEHPVKSAGTPHATPGLSAAAPATPTRPAAVRVVVRVPAHLPPGAPRLSPQQIHVLKLATHIGHKLGVGTKLAAVAFQESGLGENPISPAHYGVGSVGYTALQIVLRRHPWLRPYFQDQNWAETLINHPRLSLWVAGYYLLHCYEKAGNDWRRALDLYRYGYGIPGPYAFRIEHREAQLRPYLEQL